MFADGAGSSQHSALMDAINGMNLVISGPPGTGKSQTITNLVAAAITAGNTVVFVKELLPHRTVSKTTLKNCVESTVLLPGLKLCQ